MAVITQHPLLLSQGSVLPRIPQQLLSDVHGQSRFARSSPSLRGSGRAWALASRAFPRGWASVRPHVAAPRVHSGSQELEAKWVQRNLSQTRHREHQLERTGWTGHTHVLQEKWAPVLTEGHTPGPGVGQAEDCTPAATREVSRRKRTCVSCSHTWTPALTFQV